MNIVCPYCHIECIMYNNSNYWTCIKDEKIHSYEFYFRKEGTIPTFNILYLGRFKILRDYIIGPRTCLYRREAAYHDWSCLASFDTHLSDEDLIKTIQQAADLEIFI